ncbi:MAG: hypothetical protein ACPGFA_06675 [Pikeienuella sp.]
MKFIFAILFAIAGAVTALAASAQPAGHDAPAFKQAVEAWLDDDDQTALPALAKLAHEDNRAAQVLLGRIATRPMGSWLAEMGRKERMALLRAPGGLSGTSWLKVAAEAGDPLAQLFLDSVDPRAGAGAVRTLIEAKELAAALVLIDIVRARTGNTPQALLLELWRGGRFPATYAGHFIGKALGENTLTTRELAELIKTAEFPFNEIIANGVKANAKGRLAWFEMIKEWYAVENAKDQRGWKDASFAARTYAAPTPLHMLPARHHCDASCGADTADAKMCFLLANHAGSNKELASPAEAIVSQPEFTTSKRARRLLHEHTTSIDVVTTYAKDLANCGRIALGLN